MIFIIPSKTFLYLKSPNAYKFSLVFYFYIYILTLATDIGEVKMAAIILDKLELTHDSIKLGLPETLQFNYLNF